MKHIIKTSSPENFEKWKIRKKLTREDLAKKSRLHEEREAVWKTFTKKADIKNEVKESLLNEQGKICCYCQQRIELNENSIIEHFIARATDATEMFNYENILACCDGGQKQRTEQNENQKNEPEFIPKYCGHAKGNDTILINPLDENCESHFSYEFNPDTLFISIIGNSREGKEVVQKLNLDVDILKSERGKAVAGILFDENGDYISPKVAQDLMFAIKQRNANNQFEPFCVVLEHILKIFS